MTPAPDPTTVLDPLPVDDSVKADAWDAFHSAAGPSHFKSLMDPLALPDDAKADLWDMKYGDSVQPPQEGPGQTGSGSTGTIQDKPPKPNQVQRVSPATPNPPTAALATTPEQPATLDIQLGQLAGGQRRVVMFPKGQGQPGTFPPNTAVTHDAFGNTYAYRPDLIKKSDIHTAAKNNTLPSILGGPLGMGAPDKTALGPGQSAVVARAPDGTEAQSTATDAANLPAAITATQPLVPPGGSLSVENPQSVILQRIARTAPLSKALASFAVAPAVEKTAVAGILRKRLARSNPSSWSPAVRDLAAKHFNLRPFGDLTPPNPLE